MSLAELHPLHDAPLAPFLSQRVPPVVVRALVTLVLALGVAAGAAAACLPLPQRLEAPFVLMPLEGPEPVRAVVAGTLERAVVRTGSEVQAGDVLFVLRAENVGVLRARIERLERDLREHAGLVEARERGRRLALIAARLELRRLSREQARARDRAQTGERLLEMSLAMEQQALTSEAETLRGRLSQIELDSAHGRLLGQVEAARLALVELEARQEEERRAEARAQADTEGVLAESRAAAAQLEGGSADLYQVRAPTAGVVVELGPVRKGSLVERGQLLAGLADTRAPLVAELSVPELESGRLEPGLPVRLLLAAFPYARYGTKSATVSWVSPRAEGGQVQVRAALHERQVLVAGEPRALRAGMRGEGHLLIGRRTLLEYALEPLRRLRESVDSGAAYEAFERARRETKP